MCERECAVYSLAEKNTGPAEGKGLMVTTLPLPVYLPVNGFPNVLGETN